MSDELGDDSGDESGGAGTSYDRCASTLHMSFSLAILILYMVGFMVKGCGCVW